MVKNFVFWCSSIAYKNNNWFFYTDLASCTLRSLSEDFLWLSMYTTMSSAKPSSVAPPNGSAGLVLAAQVPKEPREDHQCPFPHGNCKELHQEKPQAPAGAPTSGAQSVPKRAKRGPLGHAPCWSCGLSYWRKAQAAGPLPVALWRSMVVVLIPHQGNHGWATH